MNRPGKQRGMTFISILILLAIGGFFVLLILKLGPIYLENYKIKTVLASLEQEAGLATRPPHEIVNLADKRLYVNEVRRIKRNQIKVVRHGDKVTTQIKYQVREHIFGNVDALVSFDDVAELRFH
jgi:hypothetical protein